MLKSANSIIIGMMNHLQEKEVNSKDWAKDFAEMKDRFEKLTIIGKGTYGYYSPYLDQCTRPHPCQIRPRFMP